MFRKRKMIALAVLLALSLTACGNKETFQPEKTVPAETETTATAEITQPSETSISSETTLPSEPESISFFDRTPVIEKTKLFDQQGITITVQGLSYDQKEASVTFLFESSREDQVYFSTRQGEAQLTAVNGIAIPGDLSIIRVGPKEKVEATLVFPYETLLKQGIRQISEIQVCFYSEQLSTGFLKLSTGIPVVPFVEAVTKEPDTLPFEVSYSSLESAYHQAGVRHGATVIGKDDLGRETLYLDFENTTGNVMVMSVGDLAINGLQLTQQGSTLTLLPKSHSFLILDLTDLKDRNFLKDLHVEKLGTFDLRLSLFYGDMRPLRPAQIMHVSIDPSVPVYEPQTAPIYEEESIKIYYAGPAWDERNKVMTLRMICENKTGLPFFIQASSLLYGDQSIPVQNVNMSLAENGTGIFAVSFDEKYGENLDLTSGSFTLTVLGKIRNQRQILKLHLT